LCRQQVENVNCQERIKVALHVDDELDPTAEQEFSIHLRTCQECPAAVGEQMELKKALRVAGRSYSAPPELHAAVYRSIHPHQSVSPWWKWAMAALSVFLLGVIGILSFLKPQRDPMMTAVVDQHTTMLASEHPVDVISDNRHNVKPWFQGQLPFTFNMPDVTGSPFTLIGGKRVYIEQNPGASLLYTYGQHKISVFVLQASNGKGRSGSSRDLSFTVDSWSEGGLQFYVVTDASQEEVRKLVSMFLEANRS
jgi:anti-sigma factor RsiW